MDSSEPPVASAPHYQGGGLCPLWLVFSLPLPLKRIGLQEPGVNLTHNRPELDYLNLVQIQRLHTVSRIRCLGGRLIKVMVTREFINTIMLM